VFGIGPYTPYDDSRKLTGVSNGSGAYTYRFVNNSGYDLDITALYSDASHSFYVNSGHSENKTFGAAEAYFGYSGGNVIFVISGNTVTFSNMPG
jgi:hypothetical protein